MRAVNPYNKFFTEDLYVENLETGNVFWGYHISNNFGRILGAEGTLTFGTMTTLAATRTAEIDLSRMGLQGIPIVQHYSKTGEFYELATALFTNGSAAPQWGTFGAAITEDMTLIFTSVHSIQQPYHPGNITMRFAENAELLHVEAPASGLPLGGTRWLLPFAFTRGYINTTPQSYSDGTTIYWLNDTEYSIGTNITANHWQQNSPHVQCTITDGYLKFRWMHNSSGTIYFKVFGV